MKNVSKRFLSLLMVFFLVCSMSGVGRLDIQASEKVTVARPKISVKASGASISLTIKKTENAEGYLVYAKAEGDKKYSLVADLEKDGTKKRKYTFVALSEGTNYVKVKAYSGSVKSKFSKGKKAVISEGAYTQKQVPIACEDGSTSAMDMMFFPGQPNIPYCGLKAFSELVGYNVLSSEMDDSGNIIFTSPQGITAVADIKAGTLSTDNWTAFHYPAAPLEGDAKAYKDSSCGFIRITDVKYEGECKPIVFDFNKYGIKMYADDQDLYLPVSLVSNILTDIATWHMVYNGEMGFLGRMQLDENDGVAGNPELFKKMDTEMTRPVDIAEETYKELCFTLDYFYGVSGAAVLDDVIREKGFEQALIDIGDEGKAVIEGLSSTDVRTYYAAMMEMFLDYLDDKGHTVPMDMMGTFVVRLFNYLSGKENVYIFEKMNDYEPQKNSLLYLSISTERNTIWGADVYREYGDTAIIRIVDFNPDENGWESYYAGEGEIPDDSAGIVVKGLQRASENKKIKNILFDLSANCGGSSDVLAFIMNLTTGRNYLRGLDKINDQELTVIYEADTNLDGVFDEKDKEFIYDDYNYGVLTSRQSFSCGNLFPILMKEEGAVLIGEPTAGGSCSVQITVQPDGTRFMMSSAQWTLIDNEGNSVEDGCKTDLKIEPKVEKTSLNDIEIINYSYSTYFDVKKLNKMMNEWFAEKELEEAA